MRARDGLESLRALARTHPGYVAGIQLGIETARTVLEECPDATPASLAELLGNVAEMLGRELEKVYPGILEAADIPGGPR